MKKSFISVVFALAILVFTTAVVFAQGRPEQKPENTLNENKKIEYFLPYPGILADHPLYPLKIFRDRILNFLIRDPVKRIEFNLLMSDKRLNMGIYLTDKNKPKLAETIISKGEKYFTKSLDEFKKAKAQNREVREDLVKKLKTAVLKHREIVLELQEKSPEDVKRGYSASLGIIKQNQEALEKLIK